MRYGTYIFLIAEGFIKQLLPAYQQFTSSEDDNVRNNATFGIGVLIATGGATGAKMIDAALGSLPIQENKNMQVKVRNWDKVRFIDRVRTISGVILERTKN